MYAMLVIKAGPQYANSARYPPPRPLPRTLCGFNCSGESSFLSSGALIAEPSWATLQYKLGDTNFLCIIEDFCPSAARTKPHPYGEQGYFAVILLGAQAYRALMAPIICTSSYAM